MSKKTTLRRVWGGTLLLAGLFSVVRAVAATSESDFLDDLPVVLTASRLSQPVSDAPAAVTIIDQDMIRASGLRDIPELLRLVPGFSVAYTADNTWTAGYHGLADAYSRRFQVLVDGRSIYSPHYGTVYWTDLPLAIDDIERIEVVRGPNAAIHGANAFVAVINIITKTAAQVPRHFASVQFGEQDMRGVTVRQGGGDAGMRYRLTASAQQRDRFERDVAGKLDPSGSLSHDNGRYFEASKTYFVNGRMDWQLTGDSDLMLQFGLSQGDWKGGARTTDVRSRLEPIDQNSRAQYLHLAYHKAESEQREWRLQFYHTHNRFDANSLERIVRGAFDDVVNVDQYVAQSRSNIELQVNERWSSNTRAVWGGEIRQETVNSPQNYNSDRTLRGELARMFANIEWRPAERVLLQGGAMLEHHYYTGNDVSPRAALNFTLAPGHVFRLGVSRAYRSPTFFEQEGNQVLLTESGALADVYTVPSVGLAPERILSREVGYVGDLSSAKLSFDVRLFHDTISDFIGQQKSDFAADPGSPISGNEFRYENLGTVRSQGGEFQLRWQPIPQLDVRAHFARVFLTADTRRENYNVDIPHSAPRNNLGLLMDYRPAPGWETSLALWRTDSVIWLTEGDITRPYTRVDARVAKRWKWQGREVEAALVGQNLGEDYQEFRDTNRFSRRVYGSLSFAW